MLRHDQRKPERIPKPDSSIKMGKKKVIIPSSTSSRSHHHHRHHSSSIKLSKQIANSDQRKNNNSSSSLIKILRPKVYITDTSSFKSLVQQLTGRAPLPLPLPLPPPPVCPVSLPQTPEKEASSSTSIGTDLGYSLSDNSYTASPELSSLDCTLWLDQDSGHDHHQHLLSSLFSFDDLEWWLHDMAKEPEVSIYDYEISRLLS